MLTECLEFFRNISLENQNLGQKSIDENALRHFVKTNNSFYAEVHENADLFYSVYITKVNFELKTECSCKEKKPCKHIAAVILSGIDKNTNPSHEVQISSSLTPPLKAPSFPTTDLPELTSAFKISPATLPSAEVDPEISNWIHSFSVKSEQQELPEKKTPNSPQRRLVYNIKIREGKVYLELISCKFKKNGGYAKSAQRTLSLKNLWDEDSEEVRNDLTEDEWEIIDYLRKNKAAYDYEGFCLNFDESAIFLKRLVETGRCILKNHQETFFRWGVPKTGKFQWDFVPEENAQRFNFILEEEHVVLIKSLNPFCYCDSKASVFGFIDFQGEDLSKLILNAPLIPNDQVQSVHRLLSQSNPQLSQYTPKEIQETLIKCEPKPLLILQVDGFESEIETDYYWGRRRYYKQTEEFQAVVGTLLFKYEEHFFPLYWQKNKGMRVEIVQNGDQIIKIVRDLGKEYAYIDWILNRCWEVCDSDSVEGDPYDFMFEDSGPSADMQLSSQAIYLLENEVPILVKKGIEVSIHDSFPIKSIHQTEEWYLDTDKEYSGPAQDWFDIEFGVMIDGERVNLLSTLSHMLKDENFLHQEISDTAVCNLLSEDGKLIRIPAKRLRKFAEHLIVDFAGRNGDGKNLRISKWNTGFLTEFAQGEDAAKNRWIGSNELKDFAVAIKENSVNQEITPPLGLQCELRPYQKEGLNWMQFLSRCKLNGILADDMGLGKTVQTLAHILVEKEQGRASLPILVICPTSLVPNWFNEAARLAPSLKVLILRGNERKQFFSKISEYDLVLTTYPLLMRDKEFLLAYQFHMIILDEAQMVKNFKTQAYQVVQQIKANQRLCLSGTPMENHLGELWSLFHLILPGFLGDQKTFQALYRKPIEKNQNSARRESLTKRIKPFILRRTKQQVALDLPEKTEIIQKIELKTEQRDLYEAIRMRAQDKVMAEINKKGLGGSQIIVLDALLKLRQVCCDPRLVKMENAIKVEGSAKLEFLMEMLTQMVEENRKVLVFSQFTSMLALIAEALDENKIPYTMLTGDTQDRNAPVLEFQNGEIPIMLISLKAGGVGLNLTAADTVIHYDPWWNPAVENQATDRAHRIGQKKAVFVYKLVVSGSLEEKIIEMQERKKGLISALLDSNANVGSNLSMEDLQDIFKPLPPPI